MTAPKLRVGIMEGDEIRYSHHGVMHTVRYAPDFEPVVVSDGPFTLHGVTIGVQFHWEQQLDLTFAGTLRIIAAEGHLIAINEVDIEDYLASVISSEMAATSHPALLRAHAIMSRSWVLRQIGGSRLGLSPSRLPLQSERAGGEAGGGLEAEGEFYIRIWDHDDHTLYDVCADDHCQRYQGITRQVSPQAAQAVAATRGVVLTDDEGNICDARFHKACGGHTERFSACWQDRDYPYLQPIPDPYCDPDYIATLPGGLEGVMRLVLNDFDRATTDYHRWTEHYTAAELSALVEQRLGLGIGDILDLQPLSRGASGRITHLRIVGTRRTVVIGKELNIRRALSTSHLKSSWFDIERQAEAETSHPLSAPTSSPSYLLPPTSYLSKPPTSYLSKPPTSYLIKGRGWGHGVGLCQIGAAAMSLAGYDHTEILAHYFRGSHLATLY